MLCIVGDPPVSPPSPYLGSVRCCIQPWSEGPRLPLPTLGQMAPC